VVKTPSQQSQLAKQQEIFTPRLQRNLQGFLDSLSDVLVDITALEVNTMVVEQITGNKFIPWQAYRDIYPISLEYLVSRGIHASLRDRYLSLRKQLEIEYCLLLIDHNPTALQDCPILTNPTLSLDDIETKLPNPLDSGATAAEIKNIHDLLDNSRFLRSLRKIFELKAALDNRNRLLNDPSATLNHSALPTDLIYAQTIIQLDGEIINRFDKQVLENEHKDLLLKIHKDGVMAGEIQWRGLLRFVVNLAQSILVKQSTLKDVFNRN